MGDDEQTLVEQAKTDQQAFGRLFDAYYTPISNYILHRVHDVAAAQAITSVVFFKAWHNLPKYQFRPNVPFSAWLYRIASNETNSYFRQHKNQTASLEALFEETGFEVPSPHNVENDYQTYEDLLDRHQDFVLIQELIITLPTKYQEVLSLRYFEQKPIKVIAQIIGKKENTVKSLLSRGNAKIIAAFQAHRRQQV